jgi:hypothetical protein
MAPPMRPRLRHAYGIGMLLGPPHEATPDAMPFSTN